MDLQLYPPVGTCYFKSYTANFSWDSWFILKATFYVYVTNAKPTDPDFTAKGGKVFIVVVYDGSFKRNGVWVHAFGLIDNSGFLSYMQELPVTGSEVKQGDNYSYTIDYAQTMSMYNNGGNTPYNFPARYKKTFILTGYKQSTIQVTNQWGWAMVFDEHPVEPTINGLQLFEANKLGIAKCTFQIRSGPSDEYNANYELDFSAETMAKAVVGVPNETVQIQGLFTKVEHST